MIVWTTALYIVSGVLIGELVAAVVLWLDARP